MLPQRVCCLRESNGLGCKRRRSARILGVRENAREDRAPEELRRDVVVGRGLLGNPGPTERLFVAAEKANCLGELDGAGGEVRTVPDVLERVVALAQGPLRCGGVAGEELDLAPRSAAGRVCERELAELGMDRLRPGDKAARLGKMAAHRLEPGERDEDVGLGRKIDVAHERTAARDCLRHREPAYQQGRRHVTEAGGCRPTDRRP